MVFLVESEGQDGENGECEGGRHGHYKRDHAEAARQGDEDPVAGASQASVMEMASPPAERDRPEREEERDRNGRNGLRQADRVARDPRRDESACQRGK